MIRSMTGFASATGALPPHSWSWELRAVNGKGLDLRLRVPDWIDGLETGLRAQLVKVVARGNVTLSLRITREDTGGAQRVNAGQLNAVLNALAEIEAQAMDKGVSLAPSTASQIIALRGVLEQTTTQDDTTALAKVLHAEFAPLVEAFNDMRQAEGAALQDVLAARLTDIETLTTTAAAQAEDRRADMAQALRRNLARVMENAEGADEGRVAQELALIAVKADVTEEIDRLRSHVGAARDLLGQGGPVGRKLDFLMQEFNREANTLCSKAQSSALTGTGLALKAVIDQMREQVQNVE